MYTEEDVLEFVPVTGTTLPTADVQMLKRWHLLLGIGYLLSTILQFMQNRYLVKVT